MFAECLKVLVSKQERDAHRCDRVKVLRYTNSLRAFQKLVSGLTWSKRIIKTLLFHQVTLVVNGGGGGARVWHSVDLVYQLIALKVCLFVP